MLAPNNVVGCSIASAGDGDLHAFDDLTRDEQHPMFQVNLAYQSTDDFQPVEFIAKLGSIVPPPRAHVTRFHGILAPNAKLRAQLTPSGRGNRPPGDEQSTDASTDHRTPNERRLSMTWAQRLKRVLNIDVSTCLHCGGTVRIVVSIEEPTARHPRSLRKGRRAGGRALPPGSARTTRYGRVTPVRHAADRNTATFPNAATIPQRSAGPAVGNWREIAANGATGHPSTCPNAL